jgi:hypothetical protein
MLTWWRGFSVWLTGPEIILAMIPLHGDLLQSTRTLRKGLRDIRDRKVRDHPMWKNLAMAGLVDERKAMILIQHERISHHNVCSALARRWSDVALIDPARFAPTARMTVADAADLARRRRGVEPLRIVIPALMAAAHTRPDDQPLPIVF